MRDEPDGNSILHKSKMTLYSGNPKSHATADTPDDSNINVRDTRRRHKLTADDVNLDTMDHKSYVKKAKKVDISQTCTFNSLNFTTSTTVGQSDTMISQSNISSIIGSKKPRKIDESWEHAVETARGQPDGAERSFHDTKLSTVQEASETSEGATALPAVKGENEETDSQPAENGDKKNKKSIKTHLKSAAKKLKSLKGKGKVESEAPSTPTKRKMNEPEDTIENTMDDTDKPPTPKKKLKLVDLKPKDRKKMRKLMKNNSEIIKTSKNIWEELRRHDVAEERRIELCDVLYKHVGGKVKEMVTAHDTARVIQCLIQFGDQDQRQKIFDEMKEELVPMAKSKYGKFVLKKIFKYGTRTHKSFLFKAFHGNVRKLIRHKQASMLVEYAYNQYANAGQRLGLLEEFYGPSFSLFKTMDTKSLEDIMTTQPDKKDMILSNMKEALLPLIDKNILVHTLVHRVFSEYFIYANPKMKSDMIELLRDGVINMIHTRDGARVGMQCIWHGTAKDRKVMIKSLKSHVVTICQEEYGHMVLLAAFDVVDDTHLIKKIILQEIIQSLDDVAKDSHGKKILLYLLSPREQVHFHPSIISVLEGGDSNTVSKKEMGTRHHELLEHISQPFLDYLAKHAKVLCANNATLVLILSIITKCKGDPTNAMKAICEIVAEPFTAGSMESSHIVEHYAGQQTLKRLISNDQERKQQGETVLFSEVLMQTLPAGRMKSWAACNRGCFTLIALLDLNMPEISKEVKSQLKGVTDSLKKMTFKGAHLLLQKLDVQ